MVIVKILFATNNILKVKEAREIFLSYRNDIELFSLLDLDYEIEVEEDMKTLEENAYKKAYEVWKKEKDNFDYVIAEDFGFFCEEIPNIMGVKSKRWHIGNDEDRANKLLELLSSSSNRKAYYKSVFVAIDKENKIGLCDGYLYGNIAYQKGESKGFSYDSIFLMEDGRLLSQYSIEEKNKISSRYKAINQLAKSI